MLNKTKVFASIFACMSAASISMAQWTTTGTTIHPVTLTNNVSIGTTTNAANLYIEKTTAVNLGIRSINAGATMFMDKGTAASNAAFAYKVAGVTTWNSGMLGSNNFSIRNVTAATFPFIINNANDNITLCETSGSVGIGTSAPTTKLHVIGTGRIEGNLQVTNNSTFGASMNVNGTVTANNFSTNGDVQLGDTVNFGTAENFYDAGANTIGTNDNFITHQSLTVGSSIAGDNRLNVTGKASISDTLFVGSAVRNNNGTGPQILEIASTTSAITGIQFSRPGTTLFDAQIIDEGGILKIMSSLNEFDTAGTEIMRMNLSSGNVSIGTASNTHRLNVCGTIRAQELRLETGWCDFVFEPDYKLRSLEEVDAYIKANKHLPDVNPGVDVETNGLQVADMSAKMIRKIEELTLYMIQANEQIKDLQKQNAEMRTLINKQ